MERFTLTDEHIKLLRRANVEWQYAETGAPAIDPKRPYGNSDAGGDVAKILGWPAIDEEDDDARDARDERAYKIHRETETALQLVLWFGFEPGEFARARSWSRWERRR